MIFAKNVRWAVIAYSTVIAVMLLQTPVEGLGTRVALATMGATFLFYLFTPKDRNNISAEARSLIVFSVYLFMEYLVSPYTKISQYTKFFVEALLTFFLFGISIKDKENRYLLHAYEVALSIWSILIIRYCLTSSRLIHSDIRLFGAELDPNFIGLPLVTAAIFLLNDLLTTKNRLLLVCYLTGLLLNIVAIIETSSRGTMVTLILGIVLVLYNYIHTEKSNVRKLFLLMVVFIGGVFFINYLTGRFQDNINRMTEIDSESGSRLELWLYSLDIWLDNPYSFLFGQGISAVRRVGISTSGSHNTYLQLLAETGLVGLLLYVAFLWKIVKKCYLNNRILAIALIGTCFQIIFLNALDNRCMWCLLGWAAMVPSDNKKTVKIRW